jgi:hypothetical protein
MESQSKKIIYLGEHKIPINHQRQDARLERRRKMIEKEKKTKLKQEQEKQTQLKKHEKHEVAKKREREQHDPQEEKKQLQYIRDLEYAQREIERQHKKKIAQQELERLRERLRQRERRGKRDNYIQRLVHPDLSKIEIKKRDQFGIRAVFNHNNKFAVRLCETKNFRIRQNQKARVLLGYGSFGFVFACCPQDDRKQLHCQYAMKIQLVFTVDKLDRLLGEMFMICVTNDLLSGYVPKFYEWGFCGFVNQDEIKYAQLSMVTRRYDTNLMCVIMKKQQGVLYWDQLEGVIRILLEFRKQLVIHGDTKPDNFLYRKGGEIVATDFGFTSFIDRKDMEHWNLNFEEKTDFTLTRKVFDSQMIERYENLTLQRANKYGWLTTLVSPSNKGHFIQEIKQHHLDPFMDLVTFDAYLVSRKINIVDRATNQKIAYRGNPHVPVEVWNILGNSDEHFRQAVVAQLADQQQPASSISDDSEYIDIMN